MFEEIKYRVPKMYSKVLPRMGSRVGSLGFGGVHIFGHWTEVCGETSKITLFFVRVKVVVWLSAGIENI